MRGHPTSGYGVAVPFTPPQWTAGDRIRKMREERGFGQRALAEQVGVTVDTVVQWEKDRRVIQPENWRKLAAALDTPEDWLRGQPE